MIDIIVRGQPLKHIKFYYLYSEDFLNMITVCMAGIYLTKKHFKMFKLLKEFIDRRVMVLVRDTTIYSFIRLTFSRKHFKHRKKRNTNKMYMS